VKPELIQYVSVLILKKKVILIFLKSNHSFLLIIQVAPICLRFNIEKKSHLNFFKIKPFFFTDYPSCFTTYQVDLVILKQLSLKLIFKLGLDKESCHEVSKLSCRVKFNNIAK
jgi:hypothetical protein